MKGYNKLFAAVIVIFALVFIGANLFLSNALGTGGSRPYIVEINRAENQLKQGEEVDLSEYSSLVNIEKLGENSSLSEKEEFLNPGGDYALRLIDGDYYRFDYEISGNEDYLSIYLAVNLSLAAVALTAVIVLVYLRQRIIMPFNKISELPQQIAKGNLTGDIKESKSKYFGRFIWGLNILRESLEDSRARELNVLKDKQTLVLSLSHDIKTPLSAIKLYSKALTKNLYKDNEEKKNEIAFKIDKNADEIESYLRDIIKASNEDFLNLEVKNGEFYLSALINEIESYYSEKLSLLGTDFEIKEYSDCLLKGDMDRAVEVIQNIIENAIKYGDGESIKITFDAEEDLRLVSISNTGEPLKPDELPHIFSSFYRGSNVKNKPGSGLGLYICRKLMNMMDGEIFAKRLEGGMCVTVVFRQV